MNQENTRPWIYWKLFTLEYRNSTSQDTFTATRKTNRNTFVHGSDPRRNGVNLGSHDNRTSTSITHFEDSHPLLEDRSAIVVS